ncbi:hypothetical protein BDZ89DRAFT_786768 [Hymenopellis radicata]|nr:hypothetical protein BDZ89DRAFT_786768 [Hymenopellis radicata]
MQNGRERLMKDILRKQCDVWLLSRSSQISPVHYWPDPRPRRLIIVHWYPPRYLAGMITRLVSSLSPSLVLVITRLTSSSSRGCIVFVVAQPVLVVSLSWSSQLASSPSRPWASSSPSGNSRGRCAAPRRVA